MTCTQNSNWKNKEKKGKYTLIFEKITQFSHAISKTPTHRVGTEWVFWSKNTGNRKKATVVGRMFKGLKTCFKGIWDILEAFLGVFRHLKPDFGAKNRVFHWKREKIQIHVTNKTLFYKYGVIRCFKSHTYGIWPFPRFSDIFRSQRWLIAAVKVT